MKFFYLPNWDPVRLLGTQHFVYAAVLVAVSFSAWYFGPAFVGVFLKSTPLIVSSVVPLPRLRSFTGVSEMLPCLRLSLFELNKVTIVLADAERCGTRFVDLKINPLLFDLNLMAAHNITLVVQKVIEKSQYN